MGPRRKGGRTGRDKGMVEPKEAAPREAQILVPTRRSSRQRAAEASQTAQRRVPEVLNLVAAREESMNQGNLTQQQRPQRGPLAGRPGARQRRGRSRVRGRSATQRRAMTVYLDGASPSESDGEQMPKEMPVKVAKKMSLEEENTEDLHITLSPDKMSRGIMSDSSDTEDELRPLTTPPASRCLVACQPLCSFNDSPSGSSDEDIFDLDYSVCNTHALRKAFKEIKSAEASHTPPPLPFHGSTSTSSKPVVSFDSDDDCVVEVCSVESKKRDNSDDIVISPPSPVLFDIEGSDQANQYAKTKKSKKKKSKSQQDEFINKEGMSVNDSLSTSTDIMDTDDEGDEVNPEIQVLIKWSSERFRLPIRKWQPFSHLYEALGKKYKVSADRVVLNLQDKIINPSHCPGDLKLTIADCIEGGIQSKQSSSRNQVAGVLAVSKDPNSILLRVQSADKKAAVTISLGLNEMMSVLMHKYAEEKQLSLDKLQFFFDGDLLNSRSTPYNLDMEDGECIDVYMLS